MKSDNRMNLIYNFMENMGLKSFVLIGMDDDNNPMQCYTFGDVGQERALRGYAEDWVETQAILNMPHYAKEK